MQTLEERQNEYKQAYETKIIRRIPVIIQVNGRNFSKLTKEVVKPFCARTAELMAHTALCLCKQIDGAVFGYQFFDEINIVIRNNQNENTDPWFGNKCQDMSSVASSIATYEFNKYFWDMGDPPPLFGAPLFKSISFGVPDLNEAVNYLISRQQICRKKAIFYAVYNELAKKFGGKRAKNMLKEKTDEDRESILWEESKIEFESDYPLFFKRGIISYLVLNDDKKKWHPDLEPFVFSDNRSLVYSILNGRPVELST